MTSREILYAKFTVSLVAVLVIDLLRIPRYQRSNAGSASIFAFVCDLKDQSKRRAGRGTGSSVLPQVQ